MALLASCVFGRNPSMKIEPCRLQARLAYAPSSLWAKMVQTNHQQLQVQLRSCCTQTTKRCWVKVTAASAMSTKHYQAQ